VGGTQVTAVTGYTELFAQWTLAIPTQAPGTATIFLSGDPNPLTADNGYEVTLYTPPGEGVPVGGFVTGTITITDSSATPGTCSSSTWSYFGPDGEGGYIFGAGCTIASIEAPGITVQATYSGSDYSAAPSNVMTVGGAQGTGTVSTVTTSNTAAVTLTGSADGAATSISIPAGALPSGTIVSTYPITDSTDLSARVPSGQSYVLAMGVTWQTPSGTAPTATSPITLTISDPTIITGDTIYIETTSGLTPVGVATEDGTVTVTFENDPAFLVTAMVLIGQSTLVVATTSGHVGTTLILGTTGGSGTGKISYTVTDGTASGCAVSGASLHANTPGTCVVTATRAGDSTYSAISSTPTDVRLALPAKPSTVTIRFVKGGSSLSASAKKSLLTLASKLYRGALVTVRYARGNPALGKQRATIAALFLERHILIQFKIQASAAPNDSVTVITIEQ
jgi:hypothetical protein